MIEQRFTLSHRAQKILGFFLCMGIVALVLAFHHDPLRAWANVLLNQFYFVSLSLGGVFFIAIHYLSNASWATGLRRVPEALIGYLGPAFLFGLLTYFGLHSLYHWTHADVVIADALLKHKSVYLNIPFYMARLVLFFMIWIFCAKKLVRNSYLQDNDGQYAWTQQNLKYSAIFLVLFALTFTLASYDWIMSLEPHWYSTIFSVYTFAGLFLHAISAITLIVLILLALGVLKNVINENHLHDLGKLIFAFSTFWAYCWFCQFMLIWYANIPEETTYFLSRLNGSWFYLFIFNVVANWLVPFFVLMTRRAKRNSIVLWFITLWLLMAHYLDLYLMVYPGTLKGVVFGFTEVFIFLGFGSLFLWIVFKGLQKVSLVPIRDPYFEESLHHHQ